MSATCRSCGAPIVWAITPKGKRMPLDVDKVTDGVRFILPQHSEMCSPAHGNDPGHRSHFATCPNADQHRGKR